MSSLVEQREEWAELTACSFLKTAMALRNAGDHWLSKGHTTYTAGEAQRCYIMADTWENAARALRQPKEIRLELEDRERLNETVSS